MADEEFVCVAITADGLLSRWSTRAVLTSKRLLTIKNFLLDSTIRGIRLERIESMSENGSTGSLSVESGTREFDLEFESDQEATEMRSRLKRAIESIG